MKDEFFKDIYFNAGVRYFDKNIRIFLEDLIKEIYSTHSDIALNLRLNHIDRAMYKFNEVRKEKRIYNTRKYFKFCLISAVYETPLDDLIF